VVLGSDTDVDVVGLRRADCDIVDPDAVRRALDDLRPAVVVNAAAYTAVDAAEADEQRAYMVNGEAAGRLAEFCGARRAALVHLSTDYVFAGDASTPYDVDDVAAPRTAYGRSKLAGERLVLDALPDAAWVVRTGWVYAAHGRNFVTTMRERAAGVEAVPVVDDQHGSPTLAGDLAGALAALIARMLAGSIDPGIYHCTNAGETTWNGVAREVFSLAGADPDRVLPAETADVPRPAARPAYSVLSPRAWLAAGLPEMPPWRDALRRALGA